jgi:DHA2 family metal-tetracycline-proton antiporter-like MFS transporter
MSGFLLLSTFAGLRPWVISLNLILCYVGFALFQSSIPYMVSTTLPREHLGVGMGVYNLFFFMSGAFSAAFIGKLLDISPLQQPVSAPGGRPAVYRLSVLCDVTSCFETGWS